MKKTIFYLSSLLLSGMIFLVSCTKDELIPENPLLGKWHLDSNYTRILIEEQGIDYAATQPAGEQTTIAFLNNNFALIEYSDTSEIRPYLLTGDTIQIQLKADMPAKFGYKLPVADRLELGYTQKTGADDPHDPAVQRLDQIMYFHRIEN